jgi:hypothetical protein
VCRHCVPRDAVSNEILRPLGYWDRRFESRSLHGCVFLCGRDRHSSKERYQMQLIHKVYKNVILNWNRQLGLNHKVDLVVVVVVFYSVLIQNVFIFSCYSVDFQAVVAN